MILPSHPEAAPPKGYRPHMNLSVKLRAVLIACGFDPDTVEFDHQPPLALRIWDEATQDTIPPANDPRFIRPMPRQEHREKTNGPATKARAQGDKTDIAKTVRVSADQQDFRDRMERKQPGKPRERSGKINSRPFPKGKRPLRGHHV